MLTKQTIGVLLGAVTLGIAKQVKGSKMRNVIESLEDYEWILQNELEDSVSHISIFFKPNDSFLDLMFQNLGKFKNLRILEVEPDPSIRLDLRVLHGEGRRVVSIPSDFPNKLNMAHFEKVVLENPQYLFSSHIKKLYLSNVKIPSSELAKIKDVNILRLGIANVVDTVRLNRSMLKGIRSLKVESTTLIFDELDADDKTKFERIVFANVCRLLTFPSFIFQSPKLSVLRLQSDTLCTQKPPLNTIFLLGKNTLLSKKAIMQDTPLEFSEELVAILDMFRSCYIKNSEIRTR